MVAVVACFIVLQSNTAAAQEKTPPDSLWMEYAKLYDGAVYTRQADSLYRYTEHFDIRIARQAWRALAQTPVNNIYNMMTRARDAKLPMAWMALSHQKFNESQLRILENWWREEPAIRTGIATVLGRQGDQKSMEFLLQRARELRNSDLEYPIALAIGRLSSRNKMDVSSQFLVIRSAFQTSDARVGRAWLYGFYRNPESSFDPEVRQNLFKLWRFLGINERPALDLYLTGILGRSMPDQVIAMFNEPGVDSVGWGVGIELADVVRRQEEPDTTSVGRLLLNHPNVHVARHALQNYRQHQNRPQVWLEAHTDSLLADSTRISDHLWTDILRTKAAIRPDSAKKFIGKLDSLVNSNPYLLTNALPVYQAVDTSETYLDRIERHIKKDTLPASVIAVRALAEYMDDLPDDEETPDRLRQVRNLVRSALMLKDRGVTSELEPLLKDTRLIGSIDYEFLAGAMDEFSLPSDIEAYQAMARVFNDQFHQRARGFIDSLASLGYEPLNTSLREMGWRLDEVVGSTAPDSLKQFYQPDWQRLEALGRHPRLKLATEKGTLTVELDPIRAPAIVSAIDSLARSGRYEGVPFHRVVPNFVIQGGDIERGDGFGGPDFVLPTEASELEFNRGAAGIASAGPDTEGSQYFFMHRWKPHLNGNYTRFGKVVEGMDVVDRIMVGDKVISVEIVESSRK